MTKKKDSSFLIQGSILAAAGIITKIIGLIYRIPMSNILGEQGNGIYTVAFKIYSVALTLSYSSLPMALSKLVSEKAARGQHKNALKVFIHSSLYAFVLGSLAGGVLWAGADMFEKIYSTDGLARPLRVLAPTTLIVTMLGVFRGFFQGYENMVHTAVSQIIEQIINAAISILACWQLFNAYKGTADQYSFGAAGGTTGTLAGAAAALIFMLLVFMRTYPSLRSKSKLDHSAPEKTSLIYMALTLTVIPIILSQTIYQIGGTIDDIIFSNILKLKGLSKENIISLQGVFGTQYNQIINLPVAIATALSITIIPTIVAECVKRNYKERDKKIRSVLKLCSLIVFPCAAGIAALAEPVMSIIYYNLTEHYHNLASSILVFGCSAVIFYSFSTITTSILQGNNYMTIPVVNAAISLGIHIVLMIAIVFLTDLNIYALVIGDITFPMIIFILNTRYMRTHMKYKINAVDIFVKPLIASVVMADAAYIIFKLMFMLTKSNIISFSVSFIIAVAVYFTMILKTKYFNKDEMFDLPFGRTIIKVLKIR
ncbi:MAG: polysaccharide biosynthesis protein [Oscillospiraceae bacterium]|nr:polysaccharide biosynthesis protein [Oscillospiraceae bacterium]